MYKIGNFNKDSDSQQIKDIKPSHMALPLRILISLRLFNKLETNKSNSLEMVVKHPTQYLFSRRDFLI